MPGFNGTPFKPMIWRMLGVKVGKRLYDAGANMPEKTLVTIGDDCAFNEGATIQGHSMEDGTFKSDYIVLGNRCSLGVDAWVNYGVTMHDGSSLGADALLMKGEDVPENATYTGNPAREVMTPHRANQHAALVPADPATVPARRRPPRQPRSPPQEPRDPRDHRRILRSRGMHTGQRPGSAEPEGSRTSPGPGHPGRRVRS